MRTGFIETLSSRKKIKAASGGRQPFACYRDATIYLCYRIAAA